MEGRGRGRVGGYVGEGEIDRGERGRGRGRGRGEGEGREGGDREGRGCRGRRGYREGE